MSSRSKQFSVSSNEEKLSKKSVKQQKEQDVDNISNKSEVHLAKRLRINFMNVIRSLKNNIHNKSSDDSHF